jgi:hypothetical protein
LTLFRRSDVLDESSTLEAHEMEKTFAAIRLGEGLTAVVAPNGHTTLVDAAGKVIGELLGGDVRAALLALAREAITNVGTESDVDESHTDELDEEEPDKEEPN